MSVSSVVSSEAGSWNFLAVAASLCRGAVLRGAFTLWKRGDRAPLLQFIVGRLCQTAVWLDWRLTEWSPRDPSDVDGQPVRGELSGEGESNALQCQPQRS